VRNWFIVSLILLTTGCQNGRTGLNGKKIDYLLHYQYPMTEIIDNQPLLPSVEKYINSEVEVIPIPGWGWGKGTEPYETPEPFLIKILSFYNEGNDIRRGGKGIITSPGHPLYKSEIDFSTRHTGSYDFEKQIGNYTISIKKNNDPETIYGYGYIVNKYFFPF
jgi:hypothetical protein